MSFNIELDKHIEEIDNIIKKYLPEEKGWQKTVIEAMNYSILAGGKRVRPMLMQETYRLFGGKGSIVLPFMAAIEMIHTYSLVHDDLPCMDNDEYRRGRKTAHVIYGEGMAVLAGDALLNYAFETAALAFGEAADMQETGRAARALGVFAKKAGIYGMIGGQTADIEAENMGDKVTNEQLMFIHENKTAALIQSAMMCGAILAGADEEETAQIEKCGYNIGIAFQIQDDILDITSSLDILGKQAGSDEKNNKTTYVALNGMKHAGKAVERLSEEAVRMISSFHERNKLLERNIFLEKMIRQLITREK